MPSGNDGIREASRIVKADAAADRAYHDRCGDADFGADPPANRSANRRTEECEGAAHRVTPEECVSEVTNDERRTPPRLRFLGLVLLLELGDDGRIGQRRGVAQRTPLGDVAKESAHDLTGARLG